MGEVHGSDLLDPDRLLERYGERIFRVARRMTGNDVDAEDVTQNTLIKILRKADTFRGDADPMGWIYRITMNEAREHFRRRARRPAVSLDAIPVDFDDTHHIRGVTDFSSRPGYALVEGEIDERIQAAIAELPDGYREAVVLHDLEGVPYKEAAELLGLGLGGFKTRLHRARLHLRKRLQDLWAEHVQERGADGEAE